MKKLASINLDATDHVLNDDVSKLAELVEPLSEEARMAYIPSFEEEAEKDEDQFALVLWSPEIGSFNKYGKHTPELVELNMAFLASKMAELPEELVKIAATNLTCAAKNFNITVPDPLKEYQASEYIYNVLDIRDVNEIAYLEKTAEEPQSGPFAWEEEEKYPIGTDMEIKKAAAYFEVEHNNMDIAKKLEFVFNVSEAARARDIPLDRTAIEKYASLDRNAFSDDFKDHLAIRKGQLRDEGDEEIKSGYTDLSKRAEELGTVKTAKVLYELDKLAYLTAEYGKGIVDPLLASMAMRKSAAVDVDGISVTHEQLKGLPSAELTAIIGNDFIPELKADNGIDVLKSLPKPVRQEVLDLL